SRCIKRVEQESLNIVPGVSEKNANLISCDITRVADVAAALQPQANGFTIERQVSQHLNRAIALKVNGVITIDRTLTAQDDVAIANHPNSMTGAVDYAILANDHQQATALTQNFVRKDRSIADDDGVVTTADIKRISYRAGAAIILITAIRRNQITVRAGWNHGQPGYQQKRQAQRQTNEQSGFHDCKETPSMETRKRGKLEW